MTRELSLEIYIYNESQKWVQKNDTFARRRVGYVILKYDAYSLYFLDQFPM